MSNLEIVRAWKDPEFRDTLGGAVPDHPAGQIEFADRSLDGGSPAKLEPLNFSQHACKTFDCTLSSHEKCCG